MAELSRKYGVSRKTIYKWKQRVASEGEAGLVDRSRAPHQQAQAVSEAKRELILSVRHAHATERESVGACPSAESSVVHGF